tara:strand:- start:169 stop:591 length:423 start_codon:yes stop_codon:yes gene_type:complete
MRKNISPPLWGPGAWTFLHYIALAYPENPSKKDKENYKHFFMNLQNVLPCQKCSEHYGINLQKYPLDQSLDNHQNLFRWTVDIHNEVNKKLNKKIYSFEEAYKLYTNNVNNNNNNYNDLLFKTGCVLLIIFVGWFIYQKK